MTKNAAPNPDARAEIAAPSPSSEPGFSSLLDRFFGGPSYRAARADVADTGGAYRITAELPGVPKDLVDVRIRGSTVEIEARTSAESGSGGEVPEYLYRERSLASFYRGVELPEPVVGAEATAKLSEGVLTLEVPKLHPTPSPAEVKVAVA